MPFRSANPLRNELDPVIPLVEEALHRALQLLLGMGTDEAEDKQALRSPPPHSSIIVAQLTGPIELLGDTPGSGLLARCVGAR